MLEPIEPMGGELEPIEPKGRRQKLVYVESTHASLTDSRHTQARTHETQSRKGETLALESQG